MIFILPYKIDFQRTSEKFFTEKHHAAGSTAFYQTVFIAADKIVVEAQNALIITRKT